MRKLISFVVVILLLGACSEKEVKITKLADLQGKRICVLTGSAGDQVARERFQEADILDMAASADAAYNVKINKADAFIFDHEVVDNIAQKYDDLIVLSEPVGKVEVAIAFDKSSTGLLKSVNKAIVQLEKEGVLQQMREKWIDSDYDQTPTLSDINLEGLGDPVKIGINAESEPMMFLSNNEFTGFDMELSLRIGQIIGREMVFFNMRFESLITALKSGKIDMALSAFNVTEKRKEHVNFSDPYLVQDISALVRK